MAEGKQNYLLSIEERITKLLDHLNLENAHFGVQNSTDLDSIIHSKPEVIASLTLIGLNRLNAAAIAPVSTRLFIMYGEGGAGADVVPPALSALPGAETHCFPDYTVLTWSDVINDRQKEIFPLWSDFLHRAQVQNPAGEIQKHPIKGTVAGISYRVLGSGPVLILLPMLLTPSQWDPIIEQLSQNFCVITLGGRHLGGVAFIDGRGRDPGYLRGVRAHIDEIEIKPGDLILDVGCGPGSLDRWLARHTQCKNPITAIDINDYFLREAAEMAEGEGLSDIINYGPGDAENLPFSDNTFDVVMSHTVMEECNADLMLAEMIRVAKPGGKVAVMVRAVDMRSLWNIPVSDTIKTKVEAPVHSVGEKGCADASLYHRFGCSGLGDLRLFPTTMTIRDPQSYSWKYYEPYIYSLLDEQEIFEWNIAKARAIEDKSILLARWMHCAVGTKLTDV